MARTRVTQANVLEFITSFYLASSDFNGPPLSKIAHELGVTVDQIKKTLMGLIRKGTVSVLFGDRHPNAHIRAFPDEPVADQLAKLDGAESHHSCAYPLHKHLQKVVDLNRYAGKPYTQSLALGTPQLEFRPFDLSVLEIYRNDPRYHFSNDDIQGSISVKSPYYESGQMVPRDQVILETFGFCYTKQFDRAVAVFVRYLSDLSPEHQQIWKAKELAAKYSLHPDYYRNSILGDWGEGVSVFDALLEEMGCINQMARAMGRPPLFRREFGPGEKPIEFSFLVRPTLAEFNAFVLLLDKMISDNIDIRFFQGQIPTEIEETRSDGKTLVRPKGSLTILNEWIRRYFRTDNWKPLEEMMSTFRDIRKRRQQPAHAINENAFDQAYFKTQREIIANACDAMRTLRILFGNHPATKGIAVSELVADGKIWTF